MKFFMSRNFRTYPTPGLPQKPLRNLFNPFSSSSHCLLIVPSAHNIMDQRIQSNCSLLAKKTSSVVLAACTLCNLCVLKRACFGFRISCLDKLKFFLPPCFLCTRLVVSLPGFVFLRDGNLRFCAKQGLSG